MSKCSRCGCEGKEQTLRIEIEYLKDNVATEVQMRKDLYLKYLDAKEKLILAEAKIENMKTDLSKNKRDL